MTHPLDVLENVDKELISDQLAAYRQLQTWLERQNGLDSHLLDDLVDLQTALAGANEAALETYAYQQAYELFLHAFRVDPHNQTLYQLAELMEALAQASQQHPDHWKTACRSLAEETRFHFKAARHYLDKAAQRLEDDAQRIVQLIRSGDLQAAQIRVQAIGQTWDQPPASIQSLGQILAGYRYLYDTSEPQLELEGRLEAAEKALAQAGKIGPEGTGLVELGQELETAGTLLQIHRSLYQTITYDFERLKSQLVNLPTRKGHVFVERLSEELDTLERWKHQQQQAFDYCLDFRFDEAAHYLQQLTAREKKAVHWLNPSTTPNLEAWLGFSQTAQSGLELWRNHQYAQAQAQISSALEATPRYFGGRAPETLQQALKAIVRDLHTTQSSLIESLEFLSQASGYDQYKDILQSLSRAQQLEEKYRPLLGGNLFISKIVGRAEMFVSYAHQGDLTGLKNVIADARADADPLQPGYERITNLISGGMRPDLLLEEVETALRLAPASTILNRQKDKLLELMRIVDEIVADIRRAQFESVWGKIEAWNSTYNSSTPAINCLWHCCASYDCLVGTSGQDLEPNERVRQATQFYEEARRICETTQSPTLTQELACLNSLIVLYHSLNQQGLTYLNAAKSELQELRGRGGIPADHAPIRMFAAQLNNLEHWRNHRERLFNLLTQYQFRQALDYLNQISPQERRTLTWLDASVSPSWQAWERFCSNLQHSFVLWREYRYREVQAQLAHSAKDIPADLPQVQAQRLQERLEALIADLATVEASLDQNRLALEQATDFHLYQQISASLDQTTAVERKYFQSSGAEVVPVALLAQRFAHFAQGARVGDEQRLQAVITQAGPARDPLISGYERVKTVIEQGKQADASRETVQIAYSLAPDAAPLAKKIEQFEIGEIVTRVLKNIWGGRFEAAGRLIETYSQERANSTQFQCLLNIYTGYQHLYGNTDPAQPVKDRIKAARQEGSKTKNCSGERLIRERDTLKGLIGAYAAFRAMRWKDVERAKKQLPAPAPDTAHALIHRLDEEIGAATAWKERRQRILDHWRNHLFTDAWKEFADVAEAETRALGWFDEEIQTNWQAWQKFAEVSHSGLESWQKQDYETAHERLGAAESCIPSDLKDTLRQALRSHLKGLVADLNTLQTSLKSAKALLLKLDAKHYDQAAREIEKAQKIEATQQKENDAEAHYLKTVAERYGQFKQYAQVGDTEQLGDLFQAGISEKDPFSEAYERITTIIRTAKEPRASQAQVLEALRVAPQDPQLVERHKQLERKRKLIPAIVAAVVVALIGLGVGCFYFFQANSGFGFLASAPGPTATSTLEPIVVIKATATPLPTTPMPTPSPTDTSEPTPSPTSAPTQTSTPRPTPTTSPTSAPTPTPSLEPEPIVGYERSGPFLDLFDGDLGAWNIPLRFDRNNPSLYLNTTDQWNLWTADVPFEFWVESPIQGPADFTVSMHVVRPEGSSGLLATDLVSEETFGFYVQQEDEQWQYQIKQNSDIIAEGPSLTYNQSDAPFNNLTITLTDQALGFIINGEELVHTHRLPEGFNPNWQLGLGGGVDIHTIIGSARVYDLAQSR